MEKKLIVSPSPHVHGAATTSNLMLYVLLALIPAFMVTLWVYGLDALTLTAVAVASCVAFEYLIQRFLLKGPTTINDYSAIITGVLLAFNLPISIPLWLVVLGSLVAIGVGKMTFGGLGRNPFNPALVGRVFLLLSFAPQMSYFPMPESLMAADIISGATDASSGATPLALVKAAVEKHTDITSMMANMSYTDMLYGLKSGSIGEIGALALLLGFAFMLWKKVITWHIPVFVLGSMALFAGIFHGIDPTKYASPAFHLLAGGAILGAVFMATDYVTSPMSKRGMAIYGIGIGVITMLIRVYGNYPEGISFAILIMNAVVPLINKYVKPARFGVAKK